MRSEAVRRIRVSCERVVVVFDEVDYNEHDRVNGLFQHISAYVRSVFALAYNN